MQTDSSSETVPVTDPGHELPVAEGEAAEAASEATRKLTVERDALAQARDEMQDKWLRAVAEGDNLRKRAQRELADVRLHAVAEAVRPFLPVLDGLERAAQHRGASADDLLKGVQMLQRQLLEAARQAGLEPVEALQQPFDPHLHEAIEMVVTDAAPPGTVVEQLQRGFKFKDRLVRPAMVKVAQKRD